MPPRNDTCNLGERFLTTTKQIEFISYEVLPPIILSLGLPGQIISVFAFLKQAKKQTAYAYQIFSALSDIFELLTFYAIVFSEIYSGVSGEGALWFMNSYVLMWYMAHVAGPLTNIFVTVSILSLLVMSIDRLFAIAKPFEYRNYNHRRNQIVAFALCLLIGMVTSIFDIFRYQIQSEGDHYILVQDFAFTSGMIARVCAHFRNAMRIAAVLTLITFKCLMVYFYRKRGQIASTRSNNEMAKEQIRKREEKILLLLTVSQSFFVSVRLIAQTSVLSVIYGMPEFTICGIHVLVFAIVDAINQISVTPNFYICFSVNKEFRRTVMNIFRRKTGRVSAAAPATVE